MPSLTEILGWTVGVVIVLAIFDVIGFITIHWDWLA